MFSPRYLFEKRDRGIFNRETPEKKQYIQGNPQVMIFFIFESSS